MRIPLISLIAASAIALGGCAYGSFGMGYGNPYSSYGYGSQYGYNSGYGGGYGYNGGYGYGSPYGYGGYGGNGGYGGYGGYGYGSPYYGWNDGYYYPGTGYYVYDSYQRPVRWNDRQKRYWTDRQQRAQRQGVRVVSRPNWTGFNRDRLRENISGKRVRAENRATEVRSRIQDRRAERMSERTSTASDEDRGKAKRRRPN